MSRTEDIQRKRRLAKRGRVKPRVSDWDRIGKIVNDMPGMPEWIAARKAEEIEERKERLRQRALGNRPNWDEVLAFAEEKFPGCTDPSKWPNRAGLLQAVRHSWWSGLGSHGVGGNWWSREVRPLWEREKGFRK